jgi:hypothetical protein
VLKTKQKRVGGIKEFKGSKRFEFFTKIIDMMMLNQMKKEKNKEKKPKPDIKGHHGSFCKSIPRSKKSMNKKKVGK